MKAPSSPARPHPGRGDCERIRPGLVAQPTNALSCVAYFAAGAWLWRRLRREGPVAAPAAVYCGLVAANGLGGIAFHGPGDRASHWLHDTALVGTLAAMGVERVGLASGLTGAAAVAIAVHPDATNAASLVGGLLVAGGEVRRRRRSSVRSGALLVAAAAVNALTRSGGPCCRPDSRFQGHALWHVLTAWAMADWGRASFGGRS